MRESPNVISERLMAPLILDGECVQLAVRIYRPDGVGPFPTLINHHGSTGWGDNPELFAMYWAPVGTIEYFVSRNWCVVVPSRRGRGGSEGMYDEGFTPERDHYAVCSRYSLPGADRALTDIDAVTEVVREWSFVDPERIVASGVSRGGILSVAHAGQRPDLYRGVINFVGGWIGGKNPEHNHVNQTLFNRGVPFGKNTLWVYAPGDPFYSLANTRKYFEKFVKAGGKGVFFDDFPDGIGHAAEQFPEHWGPAVGAYLAGQGVSLREESHAIRYRPDPTRPTSDFVGKWEGAYDFPASVRIRSVSSQRVDGEYRFQIFSQTKLQSGIKDGVLQHNFKNGAFIEFFLGREDVMIATYASEKKDGQRTLTRFLLKRDLD